MPAYNAATTLAESLESVIAQTLSDWELIVVDDGSADQTSEVVSAYALRDPRIRLVRQENAGCGPARGTAIEHSSGQFIARLDADDLYMPTYLEEMLRFIEDHLASTSTPATVRYSTRMGAPSSSTANGDIAVSSR
jgi:teichuronic acid biosynthesis glycosyltransferase TuaG